jgi:tRNA A-37 threonylcarbamoyl transferase component Bud32
LSDIHKAGLVHGNLSMDSILIKNTEVKISDFSIGPRYNIDCTAEINLLSAKKYELSHHLTK